jgi:hypothetical protein
VYPRVPDFGVICSVILYNICSIQVPKGFITYFIAYSNLYLALGFSVAFFTHNQLAKPQRTAISVCMILVF